MAFRVWIDQDLCTGDGICVEICPKLFFMHDDGLAYVKEVDDKTGVLNGEPRLKMAAGAFVPEGELEAAVEAAEECPGECIFFTEVEDDD